MSWLLLTGISILARALYGVMTKVLSDKVAVSPATQGVLLTIAGTFLAILASPFLGSIHFFDIANYWQSVILVILGQGLGNIFYFASIKNLSNGTAQITFSSILVFNTLLAILFLNLSLSLVNVIGIFLLMFAILSVVSGKVEFHAKGVALMLVAAFLFAVFQIASAELAQHISAATYLVIAYGGSAMVIFLCAAKKVCHDVFKATSQQHIMIIPILTALPSIANFLFAYYAYRAAPEPAKVAILLTAQVVVAVLFSYFLLKEKSYLGRKLAAGVMVVASAFMIKD